MYRFFLSYMYLLCACICAIGLHLQNTSSKSYEEFKDGESRALDHPKPETPLNVGLCRLLRSCTHETVATSAARYTVRYEGR